MIEAQSDMQGEKLFLRTTAKVLRDNELAGTQ